MEKVSCFFKKLILTLMTIFFVFIIVLISTFAVFKFYYPVCYKDYIDKYANHHGLEPAFVLAIVNTESGFYKYAKSNKGAIGLMQLMPTTASAMAEEMGLIDFVVNDLYSPETNIMIGCHYLSYLFNKFDTKEEVLFAYNAGEGTLRSYLNENAKLNIDEIEITETRNFIRKVLRANEYYLQYY